MKKWLGSRLLIFGSTFLFMIVVRVRSQQPQVPCYFIFGDSLSDNGNNNVLATLARADFPPYGVDFPGGEATGRFTDGRTAVDIIGQHLGLNHFIPPHIDSSSVDISKGLNYASAGAGILDETGYLLGQRITMDQQLDNHFATIIKLAATNGSNIFDHLSKCLYVVNIGSNDYLNNYYTPGYLTRLFYTPEQYAALLIDRYTGQLKKLHSYGARKIVGFGMGPFGCAPVITLQSHATNELGCVEYVNDAVQIFNTKLKSLIDELNQNFTDSKFIMINAYNLVLGLSGAEGFTKFYDKPCCESIIGGFCIPLTPPCTNRSTYVFWDIYHPTDAANVVMAGKAYNSQNESLVYPMDISTLVNF